MNVEEWAEAYGKVWEERDAEAAAALFTEDAEYRVHPFMEPNQGRDGVRAYWAEATSTQANVKVRLGRPFVDGDRATVEFWTTMENGGAEVTLTGCLLLQFDSSSGLCSHLREYWFFAEGTEDPHSGWGE